MKRILLIEDEPAFSQFCSRTLRAEGFEVDVAGNGKAALNVLREKEDDLSVIDIRTPEMNGIKLYQHLDKKYPESINKVIFITGDVLSGNTRTFLKQE